MSRSENVRQAQGKWKWVVESISKCIEQVMQIRYVGGEVHLNIENFLEGKMIKLKTFESDFSD